MPDWLTVEAIIQGVLSVSIGIALGHYSYRTQALKHANKRQEVTIIRLTEMVRERDEEIEKWKHCRFYGGDPPLKVPSTGYMTTSGAVRLIHERAVKILG